MTANHSRNVLDDIDNLRRRIRDLEASRTLGSIVASYTSANLPANPPTGLQVLVTDLGLRAYWNGASWVYPPQLIAKTTLSASTASITFGSIPQVFTNLRLVISARSDGTTTSGYDSASMRFNGATSGYSWNGIWSTQGSGAVSATGASAQTGMQCAEVWNSHFGTVGRGTATIDIPNYSSSNGLRGFTSQSAASAGGTSGITQVYSGCSSTTGAVTSVTLLMDVGNFISPAEFSLYGT